MKRLGKVLIAYQNETLITWTNLAKEMGVTRAALSRMRKGHLPDADALALVLVWLTSKA